MDMHIAFSPQRIDLLYSGLYGSRRTALTPAMQRRALVCEPLKSQLSHRSVRSTPGLGSSLFYACDKNVIKRLHTAERRYAYAWTSNEETQTRRPRSYMSSMALSRFLTLTNFI